MSAAEVAARVRTAAGLFPLTDRGLVEVSGADRVRWLDGMVSNDVQALAPGPASSGCYATVLTRQGRIVADVQVLLRSDSLWLETAAAGVPPLLAELKKLLVADDVSLVDRSVQFARLGLEGPAAPRILEAALGTPLLLEAEACVDVSVGGISAVVAAFGWSGEPAYQLFAPAESADELARRLREAGRAHGIIEADVEVLEILRIEAGVPRLGAELTSDVLPAEARLERAISDSKGCYTGQEIVARMASRGRVGHLLVGLELDSPPAPESGATVVVAGRAQGEVTSACQSTMGVIALAFVRRAHAEPGTRCEVAGRPARIASLPFVPGSAGSPGAPEGPASPSGTPRG